jgi:cation:H+ antiporter
MSGLLLVVKGSDWFVGSAVWAAQAFRIPPLIIGATVVSICTTLPETFVSSAAALKGETVMAAGNALGSVGVNTGFILAILLFSSRPYIENRREFLKNCLFLIILLMLLWVIGFFLGTMGRPLAIGLIILFFLYIINNVLSARKLMDLDIRYDIVDEEVVLDHMDPSSDMPEGIAYDESENDFNVSLQFMVGKTTLFFLGVAIVILGSNLMVDSGIRIASILGVPSFMIAVIFTSGGTSLPELITAVASVRKGVSSLGIGNIIGADILNIVQVLGISALIHPLSMAAEKSILTFQLPILLLMILSLATLCLLCKDRMSRWGGVWLFILYLIFLSVNILRETAPILGPILF